MSRQCLTNRIWRILPDNTRFLLTVSVGAVSESTVYNNNVRFVKVGFILKACTLVCIQLPSYSMLIKRI